MEKSKKKEQNVEKVGFRIYNKKAYTRKARATIKLVLEQMTLGLWKNSWLSEKTGGELHTICPKLTKKMPRLHIGISKVVNALIVQMKTEKIGLKKFLHFKKRPGFDLPEYPCRGKMQSVKHVLIECQMHTRKRNKT